jgi:hypothetical protein
MRRRTPHGRVTATSAHTVDSGHHGGHHGGQADRGTAEHGGRPRACVRSCPARMPEPVRLWPAEQRSGPGPAAPARGTSAVAAARPPCPRWWPVAGAGHQPSGGQSLRKQRTVNALMVPARYNPSELPQGRPCGRPAPAACPTPGAEARNGISSGEGSRLAGRRDRLGRALTALTRPGRPCRPSRTGAAADVATLWLGDGRNRIWEGAPREAPLPVIVIGCLLLSAGVHGVLDVAVVGSAGVGVALERLVEAVQAGPDHVHPIQGVDG